MGKKRKEVWRAGPLCLFLIVWKVKNKIVFEDVELSTQKPKRSFIDNLCSETKLCKKDGPGT